MRNEASTRAAVLVSATFIPLAIQYAIAIMTGRACSIYEVLFFEGIGFALLTFVLRPKYLLGFLAACLYFPLMYITSLTIGLHSGYYDVP